MLVNAYKEETDRIIEFQANTLTRARYSDLTNRKYRDFVEGSGNAFQELFIRISAGKDEFTFGNRAKSSSCVTIKPPTLQPAAELLFCREYRSPLTAIVLLAIAYFLGAIGIFFMVLRLEKRSVRSLITFFGERGVDTGDVKDLSGLLSNIEALQESLTRSLQREIQLQKTAAVAEMAQQVAHDIRSPMLALQVAANTIEKDTSQSVDLIRNATLQIQKIVTDLNKTEIAQQNDSFDLIAVTKEVVLFKKNEWSESGVTFLTSGFERYTSTTLSCSGNASDYNRILSNILNNAFDARPNGCVISLDLELSEDYVSLIVGDNGPGIPDKILKAFGQRGNSIGKSTGRGLGLFNAVSRLKSWGGHLEVLETSPKGTTLGIKIPRL